MREISCLWNLEAQLGEGPCWSVADQALWFVDIKGRQIHRWDPVKAQPRSWPAPQPVSFVLPRASGGFVVGLPGQVASFNPGTGDYAPLATLDAEAPGNRTNDACVDARGRLWLGTMDDGESEPRGTLYAWDGTAAPQARDKGYVIPNGPCFSPDGRVFYHTDTPQRTIYRFDVEADGALTGKRPWVQIEEGAGWPDGSIIDSAGCLWVGLYAGWGLRRYSPQGELLEKVALPCANVTKMALGGADLKTAFVTTARQGLSLDDLKAQPLAGGLFSFEADVPGLPTHAQAERAAT